MSDPQLSYDAAQMGEGIQGPFWGVLKRRLEVMRDQALTRTMNPQETDQFTHHWRGVYAVITDLLLLPERIIEANKAAQKD